MKTTQSQALDYCTDQSEARSSDLLNPPVTMTDGRIMSGNVTLTVQNRVS